MGLRHLAGKAAMGLALAIFTVAQAIGQSAAPFVPVTDAMIQHPDPADWLSWRRTLDSWGYSPLAEIDKSNVAQLRMVWARPLNSGHQEGTPLVHDGILYFPAPGDVIDAIDAQSGEVLWEQKTNSGIMGMPIAYEVDGTQYIAVQSGGGVDAQRIQDALATTANIGIENNVPQGGVVWVFAVKK